MARGWSRLVSFLRRPTEPPPPPPPKPHPPRQPPPRPHAAPPRHGYVGDFHGAPTVLYHPVDDDHADPGEVVWAWVPYEEDYSLGKDRPSLVIGRSEALLLALPFTSKDHHRDAAQEARAGRHWFDVGPGAWDPSGRPSEVRLDRVIQLQPAMVRRVGATLDRPRFDALIHAMRQLHGW